MSERYKGEKRSTDDDAPPIDLDHTLFVIFHGAIAFYDDPVLPWIDALIADLRDDHVYVCGKFLGELRIPAGSSMALSGLIPGEASFDTDRLEFVHYPGPADTGTANVHLDNVYSRFMFPRPDAILHAFNFTQSTGKDPRKLCIVPVFQYRFQDVDDLRLRMFLNFGLSCAPDPDSSADSRGDSFHWAPESGDPTPLTLHIRAEEDSKDQQPERDFHAAAQILEDVSNLDVDLWDTFDRGDILPGFNGDRTFWEIDLSLSDRVKWLTGVGAAVQRHPPAAGTPFAVTAPSAPRDDAPSCGPDSGGPV
ncbi:MAG TPA: hypothetical protein VMB85_10140 [Bryobacteraceae bacterium]|nr:hypothetical protein [Bryobacteraceae bacterium]